MRRALLVAAGFSLCTLACRTFERGPALPVRHSTVREQLVLYSDTAIPSNHRLLEELSAARVNVSEKLKLPLTDEPIHVYLFGSAPTFAAFIEKHYPEVARRRAFFVETDTRLAVYAHWGDHVAEDLRHEVAHGYLHAAVQNLPLWLDEGLAEYFEVPRGREGLHSLHLAELKEQIQGTDWQPDLLRLESLTSVSEMSQLDYAEAWAWVSYLLETTPRRRQLLHNYLETLRATATAPPLSEQLRKVHFQPERTLREYIEGLP